MQVRARGRAGRLGRRGVKRLVHDAADGARASPALRAAAEATIDLIGGGRPGGGAVDGGPHIAVAEDITGADDHTVLVRDPVAVVFVLSHVATPCKKKSAVLIYSKVLICLVFNEECVPPQPESLLK